jgi:hypothetical protein
MAATFVGAGKLVDPSRITQVFVSPRKRATKTYELLLSGAAKGDWGVIYTEDIAEWDYGDYEGLKTGEIKELRKKRGLDQDTEWVIWRDGCEGGEYVVIYLSCIPCRYSLLLIPLFFVLLSQINAASCQASGRAYVANPGDPETLYEWGKAR